jgi:hypothetical protein
MIKNGYSGKDLVEKLGLKGGLKLAVYHDKDKLEKEFPDLVKSLDKDGSLWIVWPKGGKGTDLNESIIREIGLSNGVVDVKVIAVDEVYSGLKFVFRLKDR